MAVKLFVLGLPGSGKSTMAREIEEYISKMGLGNTRINDYVILEQMFHDDATCEQFRPAEHSGFDIIDLTAFDTALKMLEKVTKQYILPTIPEGIILIEFSRNNYRKAFRQFNRDFLQNAFFLYLDAEIEMCKQRIQNRINKPRYEDDYNVSEYIFKTYYQKDDSKDLSEILNKDYKINNRRVKIIDNNCSLEDASEIVKPFIDTIVGFAYTHVDLIDTPA